MTEETPRQRLTRLEGLDRQCQRVLWSMKRSRFKSDATWRKRVLFCYRGASNVRRSLLEARQMVELEGKISRHKRKNS